MGRGWFVPQLNERQKLKSFGIIVLDMILMYRFVSHSISAILHFS